MKTIHQILFIFTLTQVGHTAYPMQESMIFLALISRNISSFFNPPKGENKVELWKEGNQFYPEESKSYLWKKGDQFCPKEGKSYLQEEVENKFYPEEGKSYLWEKSN